MRVKRRKEVIVRQRIHTAINYRKEYRYILIPRCTRVTPEYSYATLINSETGEKVSFYTTAYDPQELFNAIAWKHLGLTRQYDQYMSTLKDDTYLIRFYRFLDKECSKRGGPPTVFKAIIHGLRWTLDQDPPYHRCLNCSYEGFINAYRCPSCETMFNN